MHSVYQDARAFARGAIRTIAFATVACSLFVVARAADGALTLDAAIDRALRDAPQIAGAEATLDGARALLTSAGRLPDPELIVGVDNLPVDGADSFSLTRDFMTMRKVGLMQTVPAGAKRRSQTALATRRADLAQSEVSASRFEVASAAADAWISAAAAAQSLDRLRALRGEFGLQSSAARAGLASGRGGAADALAGEAELARLDSDILEREQKLAMSRAELGRWIGDAANDALADLPWRRELGVSAAAILDDLAAHPPLAPLAARIEVARGEAELARAERRPDWAAQLSYAKRGPDYSNMVSVELRVGLPLFARHRQNPAIASRLADVRAGEAEQEAALRMHRAEIATMDATWRFGRRRLEQFDATLLPLARDRTRAVRAAYGAGRGDLRAVLDALRDEADLQLDYVALEAEVTRAWTFLHLLHPGSTP